MALPALAAGELFMKLMTYLMAAQGTDWLQSKVTGVSLQDKLFELLGSEDPDKLRVEAERLQKKEIGRFTATESAITAGRKDVESTYRSRDDFLTAAQYLVSPLSNRAFRDNISPEDSLVAYVSKNLGMEPEELEARTRPPMTVSRMMGMEDTNG